MQFPLNNIGNISTWEDGKTYTGKLIDENSSVVAKKLKEMNISSGDKVLIYCLLYTSPSPRDRG